MTRALAAVWDLLVYAGVCLIVTLVATGGGVVSVGGVQVSVRSVTNPLMVITVLIALRMWLLSSAPLLWLGTVPRQLPDLAIRWADRLLSSVWRIDERRARRWLALLIGISALIKIGNVLAYYGFFSGDDVEVQEMSFAMLFHWKWTAWNLRSAIYPIGFVYPVQKAMLASGVTDPAALIAGARLGVVAWSSLAIWLVYVAAARIGERAGVGLIAACLLALSRTHVRFASTELPRSVAAAFLLIAFILGLRQQAWLLRAAGSGAAIAIGGVLRFSELLFLGSEAIAQLIRRRWGAFVVCCASCGLVSVALLALSDRLYWNDAFFSVRHLVEYTLVERRSSRGFEPWHFYLSHHAAWSNALVIGASLWCWRLGHIRLFLWTWLPVVLLSALPHKEARYLVPVMPFLCIGAALGLVSWLTWLQSGAPVVRRRRAAVALMAAGAVALVFELGGLRFPRSEDGVDLARQLAAERVRHVVAEQAWRLGGRLYLPPPATVLDLSPEQAGGPELTAAACRPEVEAVALRTVSAEDGTERLAPCGFTPMERRGSYTLYRRRDRP